MESDALKAARARLKQEAADLAGALQPVADKLKAVDNAETPEEQAAAVADLTGTGDAVQASIDALKAMGATAPV